MPQTDSNAHIHMTIRLACMLVACVTSQPHACILQGLMCQDICTCCHTEIEVENEMCFLTQSEYTDTRSTSLSTDPGTPSTLQGSN